MTLLHQSMIAALRSTCLATQIPPILRNARNPVPQSWGRNHTYNSATPEGFPCPPSPLTFHLKLDSGLPVNEYNGTVSLKVTVVGNSILHPLNHFSNGNCS